MNPFNQQILAAKKKQRLLYIKAFVLFLISALVVASTIIFHAGVVLKYIQAMQLNYPLCNYIAGLQLLLAICSILSQKNQSSCISWIEAAGFCNWLSQLEGLSPVYRISNKQLIELRNGI